MPRKTMQLRWPVRGVVRRASLHSNPDSRSVFPTPWSTNVRLEDSLTERLRGGSFKGQPAGARPTEIRYRDRVLTFSDNAITATRIGDDDDTTLSVDLSDTLRPALFQLSYGGATGGDVVALIPHKDSFLLGFTADETWVQQGDVHTGPRRRVSDEVGIVGPDAWCIMEDTVYFMSSLGLYSVGADGSGLRAVSEDIIPEELTGIYDSDIVMDYRHEDRGVYIHTPSGVSWFYDTAREGFWPFTLTSSASHVLIGALRLGGPNNYGRALDIHGTVAQGSANVTWAIVPGDSEEEAAANGKLAIEAALAGTSYDSYVHSSGTWSAGRNHSDYPRTRAVSIVLWLSSAGQWAFETASLGAMVSGQWR
jgi:hypothetical protein